MSELSRERWQQLQSVLDVLLELPTGERDARLASLPEVDEPMRAELARLLRASARAASGDFLSRPAAELAAPLMKDLNATRDVGGQRLGPYRIVREIGRGGMGAVYLAERADDQFQRRVAIKLLPHEAQSETSIRRFLDERQILAGMEHPAIARLLDGGVTDDALPYFVMEYVEGVPIDRYCDEQRLTIDGRLRLFCAVCDAVQYAHGKLVVHRDIKPSNILVTPNGEVRLLDFGIAKLLAPDIPRTSITGIRVMTPEYASPEQVLGEPATTATDVYSLGVLLYRLLAGCRPYRIAGHGHVQIEIAILEEQPRPPSAAVREPGNDRTPDDVAAARRTSPERLRHALAGDLDLIVLRALEKETSRRYGSVEQFSADVRRYLDGLPITARKDSLAYRTRKFVGRNRVAVAASILAVVGLLGGSGFAVWQAQRAVTERDRAQREEDKARQTSTFLLEIFRSASPKESHGSPLSARELLDRGAERVNRELIVPSDIRASVLHEIGSAYVSLKQPVEAVKLLERALSDRVALHGPRHPDVALTLISLGEAVWENGHADSAARILTPAVAMSRAFFGSDVRTAEALNNLGLALQTQARYADARPLHEEALAIRLAHHDSAAATVSFVNLAWMAQVAGNLDSAASLLRQAVAIRRRIYAPDDPRTASAIAGLGDILRRQGRYEAAEPLIREAMTTSVKLYGARSGVVGDQLGLLADIKLRKGEYAASDSLYHEAIDLARAGFGDSNVRTALVMNNYAGSLSERGQFRQALTWYTAAHRAYVAGFGADHPFTGIVLGNIASTHHLLGNAARADTIYGEALRILHAKLGDDNTSTINASVSHGLVLTTLGRYREAEAELRPALERAHRGYPGGHWRIALAENALGAALSGQRKFDEADSLLLSGFRGLAAAHGLNALDTRLARMRVVAHYQRWRRPELAVKYRAEVP